MKEITNNFGKVFILMPFSEEFDDLYLFGIKKPLQSIGYICDRVDEQHFDDLIVERIQNQIKTADFVIGVTNNQNPNVFYEIGYSHALKKKTILISDNSNTIPFDLNQYPHIIYNSIKDLESKIIAKFENYKNTPIQEIEPLDALQIYVSGLSILHTNIRINFRAEKTYDPADVYLNERQYVTLHFEIENNSNSEFKNSIKLGLEIPKSIGLRAENEQTAFLTKNRMQMVMSETVDTIFPLSITKINFVFNLEKNLVENQILEFDGVLHLFTSIGKKYFPIMAKISL